MMGLDVLDMSLSKFESELILSFGLEPDAVGILTYTPGVDFNSAFKNARRIAFAEINVPIIDIRDLINNKEKLQQKGAKSLLDKYDAEV